MPQEPLVVLDVLDDVEHTDCRHASVHETGGLRGGADNVRQPARFRIVRTGRAR
ncbi:MAG: hypothetical protein JHC52_04340, partial [Chthoniobacterales bacterium]|nr:hypothetical protein [Chthoniobacterales bacterium]